MLLLVGLLVNSYLWLTTHGQQPTLIWEDNFDWFDPSKWEHEVTAAGGGHQEFQVYLPDEKNTYTKDGKLYIKPTLLKDNINPITNKSFGEQFLKTGVLDLRNMYGKCTAAYNNGCYRDEGNIPPIASARLRTKGRFSFTYGRIEVRAKMAGGDWMWPAVWLKPEKEVYGKWPTSGEIDIVEIKANRNLKYQNGKYVGQQKMVSTIHWGPDRDQNRQRLTKGTSYNETNTFANYFHDYVLEWSENGFRYFVDGTQYLDIPDPLINNNPVWRGFWDYGKPWDTDVNPWAEGDEMAPFDQDFHFLLNVAIGGTGGFFPDNIINHDGLYPKPWENTMSGREAKDKFYQARPDWQWTWNDDNAMQVDYVRVYKIK